MWILLGILACGGNTDSGGDKDAGDTGETGVKNHAPSLGEVVISTPEYGQDLHCNYSGFTDPDGDPDHSRTTWQLNGEWLESEGDTLAGPFVAWDSVLCRVVPSDGKTDGEAVDSEPVHTPCPGPDDPSIETCVIVNTDNSTPMAPHFSGFNVQLFHDGWQPWDDRLVQWTRDLTPGTLRFPGGGSSYVYEWRTGDVADEMINAFAGNTKKTDKFISYQDTVRGKGYLKIQDLSRLAQQTGARIVVSMNAMTDSPESIGDFVRDILAKNIDIAVYELTNEAMYWSHANSTPRFWMGGYDYALDMLSYFNAIESAYAESNLQAPTITISTSDGGDTPNQTLFDGAQLADGYDGTEELGIAGFGSDWDPDSGHEKYWNQWTHHWYPGRNEYVVDGVEYATDAEDDTELAAQIEAHWPIFLADLNYQIAVNTTGFLADYFLPLHGDPHWGQGAPEHFKANISEYNLRFTTPYTTSLFSAVNAVESILRWSNADRVAKVGFHQLVGSCIGALDNNRQDAKVAYYKNTVIDSRDLEYGLFWHVSCLGVKVANRVVNTAEARLHTQVVGVPQVSAAEAVYSDSTYRFEPQAAVQVDGLAAQAYQGRAGKQHLLLTNRALETRALTLIVDGQRVESGVEMERIHKENPLFTNVGDASVDMDIETGTAAFPLDIAPYTVLALHWSNPVSGNAPEAPQNLVASTAGHLVSLRWDPVPDATGYRVKWGAAQGVYSFERAVTDTEITVGPYAVDIDIYATVAAIGLHGGTPLQSPNATEVHHLTAPAALASDAFDGNLNAWTDGCASSNTWTLDSGEVAIAGTAKNCLIHTESGSNQRIQTRVWMDAWNPDSDNPRIGLIGRFVSENQMLIAYIDKAGGKVRIMRIHSTGFDVIGRSESLDAEGVIDLDNLIGKWVDLVLEMDGQTVRFFIGVEGSEHLVAAALDPSGEFDGGGSGLYSRRQAAHFDDFEIR